ncbi:hypothetical protein C7212DRAFT_211111, partial [Tuber magnatum]
RPICQPETGTANQVLFYSGYTKQHMMYFQAITTPDGLITSLSRPWERQFGNGAIWINSEIGKVLCQYGRNVFGEQLYVYSDAVYSVETGMIDAFSTPAGGILCEEKGFLMPIWQDKECLLSRALERF